MFMNFVRLRSLRFFVVIFVLLAAFVTAGMAGTQTTTRPARIISLIPAVTEMLFAVGAGPQVVAVSSFDRYPPEVSKLQRVGALLDPDVERILSLRPDLVVVYASQSDLRTQLDRAKVPTYVYSHAGLADITTTLQQIGERVGHGQEASDLTRQIQARITAVRKRVAGHDRPRTLTRVRPRIADASRHLCQRRNRVYPRHGRRRRWRQCLRGRQAAGRPGDNGTDPRETAGCHPRAERRPDRLAISGRRKSLCGESLASLPAVRSSRVYLIDQQMTVVPGPRVGEGVELIAKTLHPDLFR